ncbi:MAG: UrcA family protein [Gammaproteobacteria bacterium]|nr:UrcA family protein [Gammaproteobacteria bacterium]MBV9695652.1 UrcA family protein [Gammaproteobacteria bacterium]
MNSIIRTAIAAALVVTLAAGFAHPAGAEEVAKITVKFGDLNVSSPDGAATLYTRIRQAAQTVCHQADPLWNTRSCIDKAIADAVTKVNQPALFTVYNGHYKPSLPKSDQLLTQAR